MGKRGPLPFPALGERLDECLGCGYPLVGIPAPGVCPECGVGFEDGESVLVVAGVAKGSGGPVWRKVAWVGIGAVAFLYSQLWVLLVMAVPLVGLVFFIGLLIATTAMAMTGKQKKRGTEMFAFTVSGFSRWTVGSDPSGRLFVAWDGINPAVIVRRVSNVWASMKVVDFDAEGKRFVMLEGGFRCPAVDIELVDKILNQLVRGESIDDIRDDDRFECSVLNVGRWAD
ncbi:MAG: hypothetical protein JKY43_01890 [Phycisphaerales bacterium]|nr:hypothetical protein [Phycisphaerales bacterium]